MAKIIKVGSQTITPNKVAGTFRTSRNSTTNPFKYNNFEGNTLQFADVFEGFEPKSTNKLRMIASSVAGSMNKMRASIAEPVIAFVNRVKTNVSNAWDYARNTNFSDVPAVKTFNNIMNAPIEIKAIDKLNDIMNTPIEIKALDDIGNSLSGMKEKLANNVAAAGKNLNECLSADISTIGKSMADKWTSLISKVQTNKISTAGKSVSELEELWKNEIALEGAVA